LNRYCWVGKVILKLIVNNNIRNSTILIIEWISENIENNQIELTIKDIRKDIKERKNKNIASSTIIGTLQLLENSSVLEKVQRGTKSSSTIYRIIYT